MIRLLLMVLMLGGLTVSAQALTELSIDYKSAAPPQFDAKYVYYISSQGELVKRGHGGQLQWEIDLETRQAFDLRFKSIFLVATNGDLLCLDREYGYKKWSFSSTSPVQSVKAHYPVLVLQTADHRLFGLDYQSGQILWESKTHRWYDFEVSVSDSIVRAVSDTAIYDLNLQTGSVQRHWSLGRYSHQALSFIKFGPPTLLQGKESRLYLLEDKGLLDLRLSAQVLANNNEWLLLKQEKRELPSLFQLKSRRLTELPELSEASEIRMLYGDRSDRFLSQDEQKVEVYSLTEIYQSQDPSPLYRFSDVPCDIYRASLIKRMVYALCQNDDRVLILDPSEEAEQDDDSDDED